MTKLLRELLFPLIAVVAAFIVGGILILLVGDNPIVAYKLLLGSALSWPDGIGYTLFHATPLIFTGLAVLVGFRRGLFYIRGEGQIFIASFSTPWGGNNFSHPPAWLFVAICFFPPALFRVSPNESR